MELTKYTHACFTLQKNDKSLVVDPGGFSGDFISPEDVVAVIVTHEHQDHFDHDQLAAIIDKNPDAIIIGPQQVTEQIEVFETRTVGAGDSVEVGGFDLKFYGGDHAVIHEGMPHVENVGVMINDLLYFPGDSLVAPDTDVVVLALPLSAPWLKVGEAIDFLRKVAPQKAFPVHEMVYSAVGQGMANRMLKSSVENTEYIVLESGESMII